MEMNSLRNMVIKVILVLVVITPVCAQSSSQSGEDLLNGLLTEVDLGTQITSDLAALGFTSETLSELQSLAHTAPRTASPQPRTPPTQPQKMSDELKAIASKVIGSTIVAMPSNDNVLKMCEIDDKMFENELDHASMLAEAKGKAFEETDNVTKANFRIKYFFDVDVCVLKKLAANGTAAAALRPRLERLQRNGLFRNSLANVTKSSKQLLHEMLVQDGMSHEDFEVLYSGKEIDHDTFSKLESVKRMNARDRHATSGTTLPARRLMEAKHGIRPQHRAEEQNLQNRDRFIPIIIPHWHHRHHTHNPTFPWRGNLGSDSSMKKALAAAVLIYEDDKTVKENMNGPLSGYASLEKGFFHGSTGVDVGVMRHVDKAKPVILAYRGTEMSALNDLATDLAAIHVPWPYSVAGTVHAGFLAQFVESKSHIQEQMSKLHQDEYKNWLITGHSLGGALSVLAAYYLKSTFPDANIDVVTFGAPAAAGPVWTSNYEKLIGRYSAAVVFARDPIPCLPPYTTSTFFSNQPHIMHWAAPYPWDDYKWHWSRVNQCALCVLAWQHLTSNYCAQLGVPCYTQTDTAAPTRAPTRTPTRTPTHRTRRKTLFG
jgi:hypothetical protein